MTARRKDKPVDPARSAAIKAGMKRGAHKRGEHTEPDPGCPECGNVSIPGVVTSASGTGPGTIEVTTGPTRTTISSAKSDEAKDAEHTVALEEAAKADAEAAVAIPTIGDEDPNIVVHVLVDGFTTLGKVWYRGEEIKLVRGSQTWDLTVDRNGHSWLDLTPSEQLDVYGELKFGNGPWPFDREGSQVTEDDYLKALSAGDVEALRRYEKAQQRAARPKVAAEA